MSYEVPGGETMRVFKKHRKYLSVLLLMICSLLTMFAFQNCGQGINSQSSSSTAGGNTTSSTPNPSPIPNPTPGLPPLPAPTPGGQVLTPMTVAERQTACSSFMDSSILATLTVDTAGVSLNSGLGSSSGDSRTATFKQFISTGLKAIPIINVLSGKTTSPATCNVQVDVSCTVATDAAHLAKIDKAISMDSGSAADYGRNMAVGATQAEQNSIAANVVVRNNTCANTLASTALSITQDVPQLENNRQDRGFRCVQGYYWLKMGVRTTVETNILSKLPAAVGDFKYVRVDVNDKCWTESRLKPPDNVPRLANMGSQIAVSDKWVAAVAPLDNGAALGEGSVYMFENVGGVWSYRSKINLPSANANDTISAAAISGTRMVIASQNYAAKAGRAYEYNLNSTTNQWVAQTNAISPAARGAQLFGASVALSGSLLVIGAPGYSRTYPGNDLSGAVYVYDCSTNPCTNYTIVNTRKVGAAFGTSVALYGRYVAIGAPQALQLLDQGDGFVEIYNLTSAGAPALASYKTPVTANAMINNEPSGMRFGASVGLRGSALVVGAPNFNTNDTDKTFTGAAFYYSDYAATTAAKFISTDSEQRGNNGRAVAINNIGVFSGCPGCNTGMGIVRFYSYAQLAMDNPAPGYLLFSLNEVTNSGFGSSISGTDAYLAVGSPYMADPNVSGGASYVFRLP